MKFVYCALALLLVAPAVLAQNGTYLMRNMDYGKKVGPAIPVRTVYVPKPAPGLRTSLKAQYPKLASRLGMQGIVWLTFDIGTDGFAKAVEFERIDSLTIWNPDKQKVAKYEEAGKQSLIDESKRAINELRLEPGDSVRHFRVPFIFKML